MTELMSLLQSDVSEPRWWVTLLLGLGCVLSIARLSIRRTLEFPASKRAAHVALTLAAALALWFCLFPPTTTRSLAVGELTVLSPGTTAEQIAALPSGSNVVALPDVVAPAEVAIVVDLSQALRLHPETRHLHVVGGGLPARDRDAARGRSLSFDPAPLPQGILEIEIPDQLAPGLAWQLRGRVKAPTGSTLQLLDPAGSPVTSATPDARGAFHLGVVNRIEGSALFTLQLQETEGQLLDQQPVPVVARAAPALRMLLLAATPDAELKYLRRWAHAAGVALSQRIGLSRNISFGSDPIPLSADSLAAFDVVMLDERIWSGMTTGEKAALLDAMRNGLGVLLRISGPVDASLAAELLPLGLVLTSQDDANNDRSISLNSTLGLPSPGIHVRRQLVSVAGDSAMHLLSADDGTDVAVAVSLGRGRLAVWWLTDSYRLVLGGESSRHATLWANAMHQIARARASTPPQLSRHVTVDQRALLCHLEAGDDVVDPQGEMQPLVVSETTGCAGYWPDKPGWHRLRSQGRDWPFHVAPIASGSAMIRFDSARETRKLSHPAVTTATGDFRVPMPRWPFFLLFVLFAGCLWSIERSSARSDNLLVALKRSTA